MELLIRVSTLIMIGWCCSCSHPQGAGSLGAGLLGAGSPGAVPPKRPRHVEKPPSASQDTIKVEEPAAVFFYPDTTQLTWVKDLLDSGVYKAIMHDYFYQMRNSKKVISDSWPMLTAVEARNCRYLLFVKKNNSRKCIDLDKVKDLYGVCLFDGRKDPVFADMPNIKTALGFYFKENVSIQQP